MNELKIAKLYRDCKKVPENNIDDLIDAEQAVLDAIAECLDVDNLKAGRIFTLMNLANGTNR